MQVFLYVALVTQVLVSAIVCFMEEKKHNSFGLLSIVFVVCLILLRLYLIYFPFISFGYLVPPGDDPANHYFMIKPIIAGAALDFTYPPLFHIVIARLSEFFHSDPIVLMTTITPFFIVLPAIAVLTVATKLFGRSAGLISFVIVLWTSNYGLMAFGDGNYPNILAAGFFLPLAILYFIRSLQEGRAYNYILLAVFSVLIVLTHHLSTAVYIMILFAVMLSLIIWNLHEKIVPKISRVTLVFIGSVSIIVALLYFLPTKQVFISALQSLSETGAFSAGASYSEPPSLVEYGAQSGQFAWFLGLVALLFAVSRVFQKQDGGKKEKIALISLAAWFLVIFVMSRSGAIGLPGRFLRECYLPLGILSGLMIEKMFLPVASVKKRIIIYGLFGLLIVFNLVQAGGNVFSSPDFFNNMIRFDQSDKEKTDGIMRVTKPGDVIIANPTTPYLPIFIKRDVRFSLVGQITSALSFRQNISSDSRVFVFIGTKPSAASAGSAYPFFANFDQISSEMKNATKNLKPIKQWPDGSLLYEIDAVVVSS